MLHGTRLIIYLLSQNHLGLAFLFNETDFIFFGLILNITNINELEDKILKDKRWKTLAIGWSVIFIFFITILFVVSYINMIMKGIFNDYSIKLSSLIISISSFFFSYSIYNKISKIGCQHP